MPEFNNQRINRRNFIKYTGIGSTVALAGCMGGSGANSGDGSSSNEVTIGINHPHSGPLGNTGTGMTSAIELAAEYKNDEGGSESLDGATVEVISGDNEGKQELGGQVRRNTL